MFRCLGLQSRRADTLKSGSEQGCLKRYDAMCVLEDDLSVFCPSSQDENDIFRGLQMLEQGCFKGSCKDSIRDVSRYCNCKGSVTKGPYLLEWASKGPSYDNYARGYEGKSVLPKAATAVSSHAY